MRSPRAFSHSAERGGTRLKSIEGTALSGMMHAGSIVPVQVEMRHRSAHFRDPAVQHAVAVRMRAVEQFLRRIAPRFIPVRAHATEIAAANAARCDDHVFGADRDIAPVTSSFAQRTPVALPPVISMPDTSVSKSSSRLPRCGCDSSAASRR